MLAAWAARWGIPIAAVHDLRALMGVAPAAVSGVTAFGSEASVQNAIRIAGAKKFNARLFRNNSGAGVDDRGNHIRWGLCNESAKVNAVMKSSDLIGITPTVCQCGCVWGVFTAIECKKPGWKFRESDQRAVAQLNFIKLVVALGGVGKFATSVEDYER